MDRSLADLLDATARESGSRPAVVEGGVALGYDDLEGWSREIGAALGDIAGQRVGVILPNSAAFVATFFAVARAGGVVAPLNIGYRSKELAFFLADIRPRAVVAAPDRVEAVREAVGGLPARPAILVPGTPGEVETVDAGDEAGAPGAEGASPAVLLLYTSGSTGAPKRVVRTHAHLTAEVETLLEVFEVTRADRFLGAAPFSHVNGLTRTMLTSMAGGATLYPVPKYSRRPVLRLLAGEKLTFFGGVPHMFILLARTPSKEEMDLSSLRLAFCASAPLTPEDNRAFFERYGVWVRQLYGSSETGTISFNDEPDPERHVASVGRALPGVTVSVIDEAGGPAAPGEEGELAIASPFAITSYEGNEEATRKSFRGGLYLSGDIGTSDDEGFVTLIGRKSLMINRGGFKVNPYEVEEAIRQHPAVEDAAVVGAPSPHGDQIVRAVVVAREALTPEEIALFCRDRIADYKVPSRIEFRDDLPRSAAGKVLRHQL